MERKAWRVLLVTAILGGCMLGPDYQRPDAESLALDEAFRAPPATIGDGADLALAQWTEIYPDAHLKDLIERALAGNLDLEAARSRMRQAEASARSARSALFPDIGVGFDGGRERDAGSSPQGTFDLFGLLSWEIDFLGVNRRALEAAEAEQRRAALDLQAVRVSLIGNIAFTYFDMLDLDNQLRITRATIETRREAVRILGLRHDRGIISGLELRQAELALAEAMARVPQLEQDLWQIENQLSILIGQAPGTIGRGRYGDNHRVLEQIPAGLPADLLARRPDLRAAESSLRAANARIGVAQGSLFPTIKLTGEFGYESSELSDLLRGESEHFELLAGVRQPIFNAGRNRAAVASAEAAYELALVNYRAAALTALREVSDGLNAVRQSKLQEDAQRQRLEAANEYLRLAELQYRNGVVGYLDVLDAQRQQFDAELALSTAHQNRLRALAFTYKALGGGWDAEAVEVAADGG